MLTAAAKQGLTQVIRERVLEVNRWGKCLIIHLSGGKSVLIHLRMTGRLLWSLEEPVTQPATHRHVLWYFSRGREKQGVLTYQDVRKFGRIDVIRKADLKRSEILRRFGPDVLALTKDEFISRLRGKKARIKAVLLDQQVMAGLGNIYADEILFDSGIHPKTEAAGLETGALARLFDSARRILNEAICQGGSTMRDYVHTDGVPGSFQHAHRVYRKTGHACARCESVIESGKIAGRTSSYCPHCQKELKAA